MTKQGLAAFGKAVRENDKAAIFEYLVNEIIDAGFEGSTLYFVLFDADTKRTHAFGETKEAERQRIVQFLHDAANTIGSHRDPEPLKLSGEIVGEYEFGPDALNGR